MVKIPGCVKQTDKKYQDRPSPPFPANQCPQGTVKKGNDGNKWTVVLNQRGIGQWKKDNKLVKSVRRKSRKASKSRRKSRKVSKSRRKSRKASKSRRKSRKVSKSRRKSRKASKSRRKSRKVSKSRRKSRKAI